MQSSRTSMMTLALAGSVAIWLSQPALALPPIGAAEALQIVPQTESRSITQVQFRRVRPYRGRYYGYRRGGGGTAAAIIGGVIIGGIIASEAARQNYYDGAVAYCMRRFRSYDPYSRTYLGYDGYRHPCP